MPRVVHLTTFARSGGGMQSLVRRHRHRDAALGLDPLVAAIFEPASAGAADVGLLAAWWWTPGSLRRRFLADLRPLLTDALVVWHNGWALPLLAPGDGALRRVAMLHTNGPGLDHSVPALAPWCDAILCVNAALAGRVRALVPGFPPDRVAVVACPVEPPAGFAPLVRSGGGPLQVGFVGRLEIAEKRVDRLPALMRLAVAEGVRAEWHVLGDGSRRPWLQRAVQGLAPTVFHGWLSGDAYWRMLAALDVVVVLSDSEGGPIALLEAMAAGVIPLYPRIGGLAEEPAGSVEAHCLYPAGDLAAAARQLAWLLAADRAELGRRARAATAPHTPEAYEAAYARLLELVLAEPRRSLATIDRTKGWSDRLPLAAVRRFHETALWR